MVQKRPSVEDQPNDVSSKQARHLEPYSGLASPLQFPYEATVQDFHASGKDDKNSAKYKPEFNDKFDGVYAELPFCPKKDVAETSPDSILCFSWASGSSSEEDTNSGALFHIPLHPDTYNFERPARTNFHHVAETRFFYLDNPPRKLVPIGPQFQANIPEWDPHEISNYETELAGSVVVATPDSKESEEIGVGRTNCVCKDVGSIRCVRQHVLEAREKLKRKIGTKAFSDLGFGDMGEVVAEKWSEEEEQLFQEVVYSNPVSVKKNFWDHLAIAFPSRTKKEIVSYYFNVFMLQIRAKQNRFDPMNVDSDNDEWEAIVESGDDEDEIEEDENAPVESPVETDGSESFDRNTRLYDFDESQTNPVEHHDVNFSTKNVNVLKEGADKVNSKCGSDYGDIDFKFDMERSESFKQRTDHFSGSNHEFEWDIGYLSCSRKENEFLPTCNMIEEVFGAGSWNYKAGDGR